MTNSVLDFHRSFPFSASPTPLGKDVSVNHCPESVQVECRIEILAVEAVA